MEEASSVKQCPFCAMEMRLLVSVSRHEHSSLHLPGRSYAFDISTMPPSSGARHNVNVYPNSCCYFSTAQYPEPVTPAQLRACRVRYSVPCFFVLHRCSLLSYATGLLAQYTEKARRRTCTYAAFSPRTTDVARRIAAEPLPIMV